MNNLTHNSFSCMFISILYMFRAAMCTSSGELIVSIRHLIFVTLYRWPFSTQFWTRLIQTCTLNGHLDRVNHSVQTIYPLCAHIRCPCLEQHIIFQLSPSANFATQMSPRYWQLPQAHPHPTSSCRLKTSHLSATSFIIWLITFSAVALPTPTPM
jgi:hypothetical protein